MGAVVLPDDRPSDEHAAKHGSGLAEIDPAIELDQTLRDAIRLPFADDSGWRDVADVGCRVVPSRVAEVDVSVRADDRRVGLCPLRRMFDDLSVRDRADFL